MSQGIVYVLQESRTPYPELAAPPQSLINIATCSLSGEGKAQLEPDKVRSIVG